MIRKDLDMAIKKEEVVQMPPIEMNRVLVTIEGITPLLIHRFDPKAERMMLEAQKQSTQNKTKKREAKNEWADLIGATYWLDEKEPAEMTEEAFHAAITAGAKTGFPITGVKQAAISAAYRKKWVPNQTELKATMFLKGLDQAEMLTINGMPEMKMDHVRIGAGKTADIRFRPIYREWEASFILEYDANGGWSLNNLVNIINAGGMFVGIGEWRPEKDGDFGRFKVKAITELKDE